MDNKIEKERIDRLIQIGSIFESMGINTVEIAEKIKDHIENCPGGKSCIEKLLVNNATESI
jgi:hypothetical protein